MKAKKLIFSILLFGGCVLGIRFLLINPIGKLMVLKFALRSDYRNISELNTSYRKELDALSDQINHLIAAGQDMPCSTQILREANWKANFSGDHKTIEALIQKLHESLNEKSQSQANAQSSADGSFGGCYSEWFMRMWATAEVLGNDDVASKVKYPLHFLDQVNSADSLKAYLWSTVQNDFAKTHEFNRVRLDDSISGLGRLIAKGSKYYPWKPEVAAAYAGFLREWQNPHTGMWGAWFQIGGLTIKSDDTGTSFHILGQLKCKADHLDQLAKTMLSLKKLDFPFGWRVKGKYENHMNWDAVRNFRCAWPSLDEATRKMVQQEIKKMLDWSLAESMNSSGVFKTSELDRSTPEAMLYGVNFLKEIGFFKVDKRFWTEENFSNSRSVYEKISAQLSKMPATNASVAEAKSILNENKPD